MEVTAGMSISLRRMARTTVWVDLTRMARTTVWVDFTRMFPEKTMFAYKAIRVSGEDVG